MIRILAGKYKNKKLKHFNFTNVRPTQARVKKSMFDSFAEILTPNDIVIKLTQVDTNYGTFAEGDVITSTFSIIDAGISSTSFPPSPILFSRPLTNLGLANLFL